MTNQQIQTTYKEVIVKGLFIIGQSEDRKWLFELMLKEKGTQV